jgi:hypothetical protein
MLRKIVDLTILSLALGVVSLLTLLPLVIFWLSAMGIHLL